MARNLLSPHSQAPSTAACGPNVKCMNTKTSQILFAYWNEVRGRRVAPRRFEIEPARIGTVLPETFILERIEGGIFRFRLAGTRILEIFGQEVRGSNFLELWTAEDRNEVAPHLTNVTQHGGVGILGFTATAANGRSANFEAILLPLVHTDKVIDRIVGSISCISPPAWLGDSRLEQRRITAHRTIWPDGRPHAVIARGEMQAAILPNTRGARLVRFDRRQFRVYDGGLSKADSDKL